MIWRLACAFAGMLLATPAMAQMVTGGAAASAATTGTGSVVLSISPNINGPAFVTNSPVLDNAISLKSKDSGGTARAIIQMFSDNKTYVDGGTAGLQLRDNNQGNTIGTSDGAGNFNFANTLTMNNAKILQWKDSGGTARSVLQMFSDNKTYLEGGASGGVFRTNNGSATWLTVDAGASKVLGQFGAAAGIPVHLSTAQTTAPALTSCGTTPAITGTDTAGIVTMGTSATGCVITFNQAYVAAPFCVVSWIATPLASQSYVTSNTAITLTQTSTSNNKVQYICIGQAGG